MVEEAEATEEAEPVPLQATPIRVRVKAVEAPDTLTCPPLQPVDYTGNLGREPGHVQTATTAPGETSRPLGLGTTETLAPLRLWIEKMTSLTMYLTLFTETKKYTFQN